MTAAVAEIYPDIGLVTRRTIEQENASSPMIGTAVEKRVIDRQLEALELASHGGYFNWPRDTTGEEFAETMNVSASTLHQHLRMGERRVLGTFFDDRDPRE